MEKNIELKYGSQKYHGFFYLDDDYNYADSLRINQSRNFTVIKFNKSFKEFIGKENKKNVSKILDKSKSTEFEDKTIIIQILEPLNKAITKVDQIPDIDYFHKKVKKLLKHDNLFFVILNAEKKLEAMNQTNLVQQQSDNKIEDSIVTTGVQKPEFNKGIPSQEEIIKREEQERRERALEEEKRLIEIEKQKVAEEKARLEQQRVEIEKEERLLKQEKENKEIQEEIKRISDDQRENIVEYSFGEEETPTITKPTNQGDEYDNIVWMNEENKDLFKIKKSVTKIIDINDIEDDKFNKMIEENSDIDSARLITNQVKIDFNDNGVNDELPKRKYIPYQKDN